MNALKKVLVGAVAVTGWVVGGVAVAATTTVDVVVVNQTTGDAVYTYEMLNGSVSPSFKTITGGETGKFTVTSMSDITSGMRFTSAIGTKKCRFSASHTSQFSGGKWIPIWKKEGMSVGTAFATCMAAIPKASANSPFNYTVQFTIR